MNQKEVDRLKAEQPDHKQAFIWRDGGAKQMSKTGKLDIELLREQRNTLLEISQAGFAASVVEHLGGIINFLDDTLDAVEEYGVYCLEEGEGEEEVYNTTSDAEHDPSYDY